MQLRFNRPTWIGLSIAVLTALTSVYGAPAGLTGFRIPIWELLLQLNLCTGFVFLVVGALESTETPVFPDLRPALQLLIAAFVAYAVVGLMHAASFPMPFAAQLFLFALSLACLGAGWARFGLSVLRRLDALE